jgi:tetratricopeptide (TPR) repeat protein
MPGFHVWLDEVDLLPGQYWRREIPKAVRESDVVLICLSSSSVNKRGYVQKEIKFALDAADEQPDDTIFIIPVKLEPCVVPERLSDWQWVNLYDANGFDRLVSSLQRRARELGIRVEETSTTESSDQLAERRNGPIRESVLSRFGTTPILSLSSRAKLRRLLSARTIVGLVVISALLIGVIWWLGWIRANGTINDSSRTHYNLGLALTNQQRHVEAESEFREALKTAPNSALIHNALGHAMGNQGKFTDAEAAFRQAIRIDPNYSVAYQGLGMALNSQRRYPEAEAAFNEALRINPMYAEAHFNFGFTLLYLQRYGEAEQHFKQATALEPNPPGPYSGLGTALNKQGRYAEAERAFKAALARYRDFAPAHNGLGVALLHQNDIPAAIVEFHEAIRLDPNYAEAHYNLGFALLSQGKPGPAEESLRNAARQDPNYSGDEKFQLLLGLSLAGQRKFAEASDQFQLAIVIKPNDPIAHNAKALALAAQKLEFETELTFNEMRRVDPNFIPAKDLNQLRSQLEY